jgi:hypothetical protein
MITRWVLRDDTTNAVEPEGYASETEAWNAAVGLAQKANRSPYEWTAFEVSFEVK